MFRAIEEENYVIVKDSELPDEKFDRLWTKFYQSPVPFGPPEYNRRLHGP